MWKLFCPSPYLLCFDSAFHQGIQFSLFSSVSFSNRTHLYSSGVQMITPLFKDLIRGGMVIIITAVTTTTAAVMVSLQYFAKENIAVD